MKVATSIWSSHLENQNLENDVSKLIVLSSREHQTLVKDVMLTSREHQISLSMKDVDSVTKVFFQR